MYVLPPRPLPRTATYAFVSPKEHQGAFDPAECRAIFALPSAFEPGTVEGGVVKTAYRNADVATVALTPDTAWIFGRVAAAAAAVNQQFWAFDLAGITNPHLQLVRYRVGQHHAWHRDGCDGVFSTRKLSVTVQLNTSSEFQGGELQFFDREEPTRIPAEHLEQGTIVVFPSYLLHRVTPVTAGIRHALVVWIDGPPYR